MFLIFFAGSSIKENRPRPLVLNLIVLILFSSFWILYPAIINTQIYLLIPPVIIIALVIPYFSPTGKTNYLKYGTITEKVDERDTMFAREEYEKGSDKYEKYYSAHPGLKKIDDKIRALPGLLQPGGRFYHKEQSEYVLSIFEKISRMTTSVDGLVNPHHESISPEKATAFIKNKLSELGADEIGIAKLNPMLVYSHVGRGPEPWGAPIENNHRFAIVFSVEMDYRAVRQAPRLPAVIETAVKYLQAATISTTLAAIIRAKGFPARAHISDSNYQIILPAVAHEAGLGEISRMGYLISPKFGGRIRLGGVTTDMPLTPDKPVILGVQDFCEICLKCAKSCPSRAIPSGAKTIIKGVEKWDLNKERCLYYWRVLGTDCAICMKVCPFSHPPTLVHNIVRTGIARSSFARRISLWGDNLFYVTKS